MSNDQVTKRHVDWNQHVRFLEEDGHLPDELVTRIVLRLQELEKTVNASFYLINSIRMRELDNTWINGIYQTVKVSLSRDEKLWLLYKIAGYPTIMWNLSNLYDENPKVKLIVDTVDSWQETAEFIHEGYPYWGQRDDYKSASSICK